MKQTVSEPVGSIPYVAFLRGINVGGNKLVKMESLKRALASLGLKHVKTLLASGNVLFETSSGDTGALVKKIEEKLHKTFGHEIPVILRTFLHIQALNEKNPFQNVTVTPAIRRYVTFLAEPPAASRHVPVSLASDSFRILSRTETEVCSVLDLARGGRSVDGMQRLEKEFGKNITTRNWNTVQKLLVA